MKEILVIIPWAPEVFLACDEEFRRPQADDTNGEVARKNPRGSLFLDLTETAHEKPLAPRVLSSMFFLEIVSKN